MGNYFEVVREGGILPTRATKGSAGYDLYVSEDIVIPSYQEMSTYHLEGDLKSTSCLELEQMDRFTRENGFKPTLVPTGVACHLDEGYYLQIVPRSSTPLKYWLIVANSPATIDADFYPNPMYIQVINLSFYSIQLKAGDRIAQAIFHKHEIADNEVAPEEERNGGFGSTGASL